MIRWNSTKTYTEDDIFKMQQEAVSRVHEFQERSQYYTAMPPHPFGEANPAIEMENIQNLEQQVSAHSKSPAASPASDPISGLLGSLDGETLLIIGLMYLLYTEKADNMLLLALAYILL